MVKNKRILITGIAGSIGSELARQLSEKNKVYGVDINETGVTDLLEELKGGWIYARVGDIRDEKVVEDVFSDFKPQLVFHCAAYKHVAPMERYPLEAIKTNVLGTYNVIYQAKRWESLEKFVFISTDKVVQNSSIMGATKKLGEIMTKNQGKGFVVVRFGNVLGSRGSVLPIWQRQMQRGEPMTVTNGRMERYFMTIQEACELVVEAAEVGKGGEIIVLDMGKPVNILALAEKIVKESRADVPIKMIGKREGEELTEKIMLEEESQRAVKRGKFYLIR